MRPRLSIIDAAKYLYMRERAIEDLARAGKIPHRKIGKDYFFDQDELDAWWDDQPGTKHPAILTVSQPVTKGIEAIPQSTSDPVISLVRGPKGRNRERLAKG